MDDDALAKLFAPVRGILEGSISAPNVLRRCSIDAAWVCRASCNDTDLLPSCSSSEWLAVDVPVVV